MAKFDLGVQGQNFLRGKNSGNPLPCHIVQFQGYFLLFGQFNVNCCHTGRYRIGENVQLGAIGG